QEARERESEEGKEGKAKDQTEDQGKGRQEGQDSHDDRRHVITGGNGGHVAPVGLAAAALGGGGQWLGVGWLDGATMGRRCRRLLARIIDARRCGGSNGAAARASAASPGPLRVNGARR